MTTAHGQLRFFVDRVLNLKKQQDALGEDIKQVYSEAYAARFDKTAMGKVVNHLRRHAKAGAKARVADATFEEYLLAYEHGTELANNSSGAHPHAGETSIGNPIDPPHDPTTGELIDDVPGNGPATGAGQRERSSEDASPSEEGADAIALDAPSSQLNPEAKATEVEPGNAEGIEVPVRLNNDREGVASRLAGGRTPAGEGAEPSGDDAPHHVPQSGAPLTPDAPGSSPGPVPVETPGALNTSDPYAPQARDGRLTEKETGDPVGSGAASAGFLIAGKSPDPSHQFPCEANGWAGLEPLPQFDRRRPAA